MDLAQPGAARLARVVHRTFAQPIQVDGRRGALERLRAIVRPFILRPREGRRRRSSSTCRRSRSTKDYCRLTVEQASLYQATVDRWIPRVEAHEDRFGRRGAVLAMLGHLKQVCNHPEMLVHDGPAAGGPLAASSSGSSSCCSTCRQGDKSLVFTQYPSFAGLVPHLAERLGKRGRLLPRPAERAPARGAAGRRSRARRRPAGARRSRSAPAAAA